MCTIKKTPKKQVIILLNGCIKEHTSGSRQFIASSVSQVFKCEYFIIPR